MSSELHTDIAIIGAGPAGIAAAIAACAQGAHVTLVDDNPRPGGQIWRGGPSQAPASASSTFRQLADSQARLLSGFRVAAIPAPGQLLLEDPHRAQVLRYGKLIIASGARERLLPFPGWTLPGVTGAGGLQALVKGGLDVRDQHIVLAGTGPLLLASAATLRAAGAQVLLIAEQAPWSQLARFGWALKAYPAKLAQAASLAWQLGGVPYHHASHVLAALGQTRLEGVQLQLGARTLTLPCDWLGVGYGLLPNTELLRALHCQISQGAAEVDALMQTSQAGIYAVGEATGIGGVDKALLEGRIAGLAATGAAAAAQALAPKRKRQLAFAALLDKHFALQPAITQLAQPDTLVCRCEDVSHASLQLFDSWREAKLQTRCGMGACQGRICGAACESLYGWQGSGDRPPLLPTRLGSLLEPTLAKANPT
ncbi:FAD/NAD(P)-binding oxidoreductase [Chitinimonas viridis]|uniref:FAD/NAD(P)-binding oxidoreductase n=1 Tax=Chitinimonas viridis TaxID=664880 RepID=A0ABT8B1U3_9NEIS|nr:FAD/NAD(P)-binding oxidoreductase [Chitinimonas viridis]MDN3575847.1 FAD/NAD(P)-binding oxidoreductase [Chitinimonas viridis]